MQQHKTHSIMHCPFVMFVFCFMQSLHSSCPCSARVVTHGRAIILYQQSCIKSQKAIDLHPVLYIKFTCRRSVSRVLTTQSIQVLCLIFINCSFIIHLLVVHTNIAVLFTFNMQKIYAKAKRNQFVLSKVFFLNFNVFF